MSFSSAPSTAVIRALRVAVVAAFASLAFGTATASAAAPAPYSSIPRLSWGTMCGLQSNGTIKCWGYNGNAEFGNGTTTASYSSAVTVPGITNAIRISQHSFGSVCAILADKTAKCWGNNHDGQLGNGSMVRAYPWAVTSPVVVSGLTNVADIAIGSNGSPADQSAACALINDGTVKCWGGNYYGQLGDGTLTSHLAPASVPGITNAVRISGNGQNFCALLADTTIKCWGRDDWATSGAGTQGDSTKNFGRLSPVTAVGVTGVTDVSAGPGHTCVVLDTGAVNCWGNNQFGQLGVDPTVKSYAFTPFAVPGITTAVKVYVYGYTTCVLLADGSAKCMGLNNYGTLGLGSSDFLNHGTPTSFGGGATGFVSLAMSTSATCGQLADGTIKCIGKNLLGEVCNGGTTEATSLYTACAIAPPPVDPPAAPTIGAKPSAQSSSATGTFSFTSDTGSTFECQVDTGSWAACTSPFTTASLADGSHTLNVRALKSGKTGDATSVTWTVDRTAPAAPSLTGAPPANTQSGSALIGFTAESGATLTCSIDGGAYSACVSPQVFTGLGDGPHSISVKATDAAGNTSTAATASWTVDTSAPSAPTLSGAPASRTNSTSQNIALSGEAGATFLCSTDGGAYVTCTSPVTRSGLAEGAHSISVKQTDGAGNVSSATSASWTVDTTAPAAPTLTSAPSGKVASANASVEFTAESGSTTTCSVDGGAYAACSSPLSLTGLFDGHHTVSVKATDAAGNVSSAATTAWTVRTGNPPAPALDGAPAAATSATDLNVSFAGETGDTFECAIDGGAYVTCTSPFAQTGLAEGEHSLSVRVTDDLGHIGDATTVNWVVDLTAPDAPGVTGVPSNNTLDRTASLSFVGESGGSFECSLNGGPYSPCSNPFALSGLADGPQAVHVRQVDAAGNAGAATLVEWVVGPAVPTPPAGDVGATISGPGSKDVAGKLVFNSASMLINTVWPLGARTVTFANNLGFAGSKTVPVGSTASWLHTAAKDGTAGTANVYFRFAGDRRINPDVVYTVPFSWDRQDPFLSMAARKHSLGFGVDSWKVRLVGSDGPNGSGVRLAQFWMKPKGMPTAAPTSAGPGFVTAFDSVVTVPGSSMPVWARISDAMGNWSRWYLVK